MMPVRQGGADQSNTVRSTSRILLLLIANDLDLQSLAALHIYNEFDGYFLNNRVAHGFGPVVQCRSRLANENGRTRIKRRNSKMTGTVRRTIYGAVFATAAAITGQAQAGLIGDEVFAALQPIVGGVPGVPLLLPPEIVADPGIEFVFGSLASQSVSIDVKDETFDVTVDFTGTSNAPAFSVILADLDWKPANKIITGVMLVSGDASLISSPLVDVPNQIAGVIFNEYSIPPAPVTQSWSFAFETEVIPLPATLPLAAAGVAALAGAGVLRRRPEHG